MEKLTITKIRQASAAAGHVFFDESHLKVSRTLPEVYQGNGRALFITQDQEPGDRVKFRLWEFHPDTSAIRIVFTFETLAAAQEGAQTATAAAAV